MGTVVDMKRRKTRLRKDDDVRRKKIADALRRIHRLCGAVLSKKNEDELQPESLIAIQASNFRSHSSYADRNSRMPFQN